jgi:parvulin-like peptidyl-prolyl isomerase
VRLRLIRVATGPDAEDVARRARAGEDFAALARALSSDPSATRGGDLGFLAPADLAEPLATAVARLAPGEVSGVIETGDGFVVLKRER